MAKSENLVRLARLLEQRQHVSFMMIRDTLKISRATVFRYLRSLSELNVPVFLDRGCGGYRTNSRSKIPETDFSVKELLILRLGLSLLTQRLNEEYTCEVGKIISKIDSLGIQSGGNLASYFAEDTNTFLENSDLSGAITEAVALAAVTLNCKVELRFDDKSRKSSESVSKATIHNPTLTFRNGWRIGELSDPEGVSYALDKVVQAQLA